MMNDNLKHVTYHLCLPVTYVWWHSFCILCRQSRIGSLTTFSTGWNLVTHKRPSLFLLALLKSKERYAIGEWIIEIRLWSILIDKVENSYEVKELPIIPSGNDFFRFKVLFESSPSSIAKSGSAMSIPLLLSKEPDESGSSIS